MHFTIPVAHPTATRFNHTVHRHFRAAKSRVLLVITAVLCVSTVMFYFLGKNGENSKVSQTLSAILYLHCAQDLRGLLQNSMHSE